MDNLTQVTEFLPMRFSDIWEFQILLAGLFLLLYLAAQLGNLLIDMIITLDQYLHTPMYFFLKNLSFLDLFYISVTVPKSIHSSMTHSNSISYLGYMAQVYFFFAFASAELAFLTVMYYDLLCCHLPPPPIWSHYDIRNMPPDGSHYLAKLVFLCSSPPWQHVLGAPFRSNTRHQFFCDIPRMWALISCEVFFVEFVTLALSSSLVLICLFL
uniref:G-protein coupled receptors family 1 profile domain-containing protein n=1 Tax=Equus caballus TaxID=9796 RepID=A0A9L0R5B0_HORSE